MGTPEIAAVVLKALIDSKKHDIAAVVTQPDKPNGRGNEVKFGPVKELALSCNIKVLQPQKASDPLFIDELKEINPDVICVAAYGKILRPAVLDLPKFGCINVHASLLPKYRGASPIQWAVINGDDVSGVTIMHMAEGLDTGDMIIQREVKLDEKETAETLHDKLAECGGPLLLEALDMLEKGTAPRVQQDDEKSTYVTTIDKTFGNVDFNEPAEKIERLIRGLYPWPSAFTKLNGKVLKLFAADVIPDSDSNETKTAGTVVGTDNGTLDIYCGKGILSVKELQLEGKKRMNSADFLRGCRIEKGTVLGN